MSGNSDLKHIFQKLWKTKKILHLKFTNWKGNKSDFDIWLTNDNMII